MLELPIGEFITGYQQLTSFGQMFAMYRGNPASFLLIDADYRQLLAAAEDFQRSCEAMQFHVSLGAARRVCDEFRLASASDGNWTFDQRSVLRCSNALDQLHGCLRHESALKVAIVLPAELAPLFSPSVPLFGTEVSNRFPSIAAEINEAGKCLALGRTTASVFHLMRTLEAALNAVHLCLGLSKPNNPNWGVLLGNISSEVSARGSAWAEKSFFQAVQGQLDIVRQAWRNSTMHVQNVYTEQEARILFHATSGLMQKVSGRMDENGTPFA